MIATFTSEQQDLWDQLRTGLWDSERRISRTKTRSTRRRRLGWDALDNVHGLPSAVAAQVLTDSSDRISVELSPRYGLDHGAICGVPVSASFRALASAVLQLQQKAQDDIADASRAGHRQHRAASFRGDIGSQSAAKRNGCGAGLLQDAGKRHAGSRAIRPRRPTTLRSS